MFLNFERQTKMRDLEFSLWLQYVDPWQDLAPNYAIIHFFSSYFSVNIWNLRIIAGEVLSFFVFVFFPSSCTASKNYLPEWISYSAALMAPNHGHSHPRLWQDLGETMWQSVTKYKYVLVTATKGMFSSFTKVVLWNPFSGYISTRSLHFPFAVGRKWAQNGRGAVY